MTTTELDTTIAGVEATLSAPRKPDPQPPERPFPEEGVLYRGTLLGTSDRYRGTLLGTSDRYKGTLLGAPDRYGGTLLGAPDRYGGTLLGAPDRGR
jgi:hypothetical protein